MTAISFTVPGAPVPKARPRVYKGRAVTEPRTVAYEALVRLHALKARQEANRAGIVWPLDARYELEAFFGMPSRRRVDLDNLVKSVSDACNAVLYTDDSQIESIVARRVNGSESPQAVVTLRVIQEAA